MRCSADGRVGAMLVFAVGLWTTSAVGQTRFPTHVACVGDSITAGDHASSPLTTYPADLQQFLGAATAIGNFGVVGADLLSTGDIPYVAQTAFSDATVFVSNADVGSVVDVLIMLGTNDSKPDNWTPSDGGTSATQFAADYAAMVDHFTGLPTQPVVYLVLPPTAYGSPRGISNSVIQEEIIPIIKTVAAQKGMPFIDVNTPTAGHPEYFSADGVHPNDVGYRVIAQTIYTGITGLAAPVQDAGNPSDGGAPDPIGAQSGESGGCSCGLGGDTGHEASVVLSLFAVALTLARLRSRPRRWKHHLHTETMTDCSWESHR